jgi:predicted DNA-binding protein YlxM (UPF0122 family)
MAKLTESYLRKLIKQVMRENMGSENPDDVERAVEQWYMAGDATVEEIAAEFGVSAAAMHRSIDEDERKAAEDQGDYEDTYDLLESLKKSIRQLKVQAKK